MHPLRLHVSPPQSASPECPLLHVSLSLRVLKMHPPVVPLLLVQFLSPSCIGANHNRSVHI